ncbi:hypothetical protein SAMN05421854_107127 [Amycolatopsis rubida]|uniref:Uncharacterized protein n=1 Tax=Amycolatopsis rubida TaxID=112413 RepID=A0A1I5TJB1_9PSEU|nr:hypothetical protein SAMN05421854_107127 [Amycolatopsis rubida]
MSSRAALAERCPRAGTPPPCWNRRGVMRDDPTGSKPAVSSDAPCSTVMCSLPPARMSIVGSLMTDRRPRPQNRCDRADRQQSRILGLRPSTAGQNIGGPPLLQPRIIRELAAGGFPQPVPGALSASGLQPVRALATSTVAPVLWSPATGQRAGYRALGSGRCARHPEAGPNGFPATARWGARALQARPGHISALWNAATSRCADSGSSATRARRPGSGWLAARLRPARSRTPL